MIEISHLTKKYGAHMAVDDLSLTMEPGRIYGFLGPNGAGKSTTMNIITGYLGATDGEVKINGFDIFEHPQEARRCVGYLPELPPLYQEMTVLEYLQFVAELKEIKKDQRRDQIEEVMELTGVAEMSRRLIRNLSKGYRQRVGLAQAILGKPQVVILDEPTVGLDPKQIIEMRELIRELGKSHTVILSSHILPEVSAVCDHIFILSKGRLVASDSTEQLTHSLAGAPQLTLELKGQREAVEALVAEIQEEKEPRPAEALLTAGSQEGLWQVKLELSGTEELREKIFYACAKAEIPIYRMQLEEHTLEDVFLNLTGGEQQ
ncbi:MAG: ABC transporter ATP-binding protein [Lachnospiraceae bacterium]|nr:ABC transporter ATP-binding protein [Lachnospiraceae bacterium]